MSDERYRATYRIETPLDPRAVAETMAGEQSSGTFTRVAGETDDLRARTRAHVIAVDEEPASETPSLDSAFARRRGLNGPFRRATVTLSFPVANTGANLSTLAATVAGNLYDLGEITGLRLERLDLPLAYRQQFPLPRFGVQGTRRLAGVPKGPLIGTIIKPNVGLSSSETARTVKTLAEAGLDFIKDDEISANPVWAPLAERIPAVMAEAKRHEDRTGKRLIVAFNITDETDAMRRHADLIAREGGCCAMVSLNWCGFSAVETLYRSTGLILHGHRNGYGALSRHPLLGIGFHAYQALWRLTGIDHMHVHGLQGKFAQTDDEVITSARDCLTPLAEGIDDIVLPAFSSGQSAATVQATWDALGHSDLLFMAGGGVLAHPMGPTAGALSIKQAWSAVAAGESVAQAATRQPELQAALSAFAKG